MTNTNPDTGIRYGIISANSLHPEVVDVLCYGPQAKDVRYEEACADLASAIHVAVADFLSRGQARTLIDEALEMFEFECEEPIYEGTFEGVRYSTTWLGGALHVWVFESPHVTKCEECSPCVPRAGLLTSKSETGVATYDVPSDWRLQNEDS